MRQDVYAMYTYHTKEPFDSRNIFNNFEVDSVCTESCNKLVISSEYLNASRFEVLSSNSGDSG